MGADRSEQCLSVAALLVNPAGGKSAAGVAYRGRRAVFPAAWLWVTAYDPREFYAAGLYPNQSRGGDGLPAYVARRRPVDNADIVLWVTLGFHHLPRPEDWPVLPTMWHSVALVPYGFFDHNPSVQVPQEIAPGKAGK